MTAAIILDHVLIVSSFALIFLCVGFVILVSIELGTLRDMPKYKRAIMPLLTAMAIPSAIYLILNPIFSNAMAISCGVYLLLYAMLWYYVLAMAFIHYRHYIEGRIFIVLIAFFLPVSILYLLVSFGIIV